MTKRDVLVRYKGSFIGLGWSLFNPLLLLFIYTYVFSEIFKYRWDGDGINSRVVFSIVMFVGMIVLNLFNDIINKAPYLIITNVNYVKKVVFPLEVLPVVSVLASMFNSIVSVVVLIFFCFCEYGYLNWTILYLPVIFMPLALVILGLSYILSALAVYVRDVTQSVGVISALLIFLTPVFYPVSAVPQNVRYFILMNPLSFIIEQMRDIVVFGVNPNWIGLLNYTIISVFICWSGFVFFQITRKGFSDVL
jgi:lipopolysaccharide transport system permease protein